MNRRIIATIVAFVAAVSFAQAQSNADSSPHLSFKGVPIDGDGTLNEYISKMRQQGFTHIGTEDEIAILQGDFAAYKDCTVGVTTLKQKDLVSKITVIFPERDNWSSLSNNYFSLKEMLTEKYGEPSDSEETFESYSQPRDDGSKMTQVRLDQCKYYAIYETEKGNIELSISGGIESCFVRLSYFDRINGNIIRSEAMDDL